MPASSAAPTTASVPAASSARPKLLQPRPTSDSSSAPTFTVRMRPSLSRCPADGGFYMIHRRRDRAASEGVAQVLDFDLTDEQQLFRDTVRSWCEREVTRDYVRACDREHRAPTELFKAIADQGWLGINIPTEYGGLGGGATEVALLLQEVGRVFLD